MTTTLAALALLATRLQAPLLYAEETRVRVSLMAGTAAQATALARLPAYEGWTYLSQSWRVTDKPSTGVPVADPTTTQAIWDANPGVDLRRAIPEADVVGSLVPSLPGLPPLRITGGDPALGVQLRFAVDRRCVAGQEADVRALVGAIKGTAPLGRWAAADALLSPWGKAVVSATWPKP